MSSFSVVNTVVYSTYQIGGYGFRVALKKAKICSLIQSILGIILGIVIFLTSSYIVQLWNSTPEQMELFNRTLKVYALNLPFLAFSDFLYNYVMFTCDNKHSLIGNIIYYTVMILLDALVLFTGGDLPQLILTTGISNIVYIIYLLIASDFLKLKERWSWVAIKILLIHGVNTWINRVAVALASVVYSIWASKLGTELYAIHSVCYSTAQFAEGAINSIYVYLTVTLAKINDSIDKFKKIIETLKQYGLFYIVFSYTMCYTLIFVTHGKVEVWDCLGYGALYMTVAFGSLLYESMGSFVISEHQTSKYALGGLACVLVRIPVVIIGMKLGLGLIPFAVAGLLDYLSRGIYFYVCGRKLLKNRSCK
jgi:Na+-driven multidrug efflux pump